MVKLKGRKQNGLVLVIIFNVVYIMHAETWYAEDNHAYTFMQVTWHKNNNLH